MGEGPTGCPWAFTRASPKYPSRLQGVEPPSRTTNAAVSSPPADEALAIATVRSCDVHADAGPAGTPEVDEEVALLPELVDPPEFSFPAPQAVTMTVKDATSTLAVTRWPTEAMLDRAGRGRA